MSEVSRLSQQMWDAAPSLGQGCLMALGLLGLAWAITQLKAWLSDGNDPAADFQELRSTFEEMRHRGDLSPEEFRSIKSRLVTNANRPEAEISASEDLPPVGETNLEAKVPNVDRDSSSNNALR